MPPGGFGPDPRYGYPMVPPQPYTAPPPPPMVPRPRPVPYIVEEQTCNAAQTMVSWIMNDALKCDEAFATGVFAHTFTVSLMACV